MGKHHSSAGGRLRQIAEEKNRTFPETPTFDPAAGVPAKEGAVHYEDPTKSARMENHPSRDRKDPLKLGGK